jgi:dTDP-4-amino-4,6-dideoxygalactose transaminase
MNMTNVEAAIGIEQIKRLDSFIEKRKEFPSKLATQTFFPDNIFTNQHNAVFRKLFGFDGADGPSHA